MHNRRLDELAAMTEGDNKALMLRDTIVAKMNSISRGAAPKAHYAQLAKEIGVQHFTARKGNVFYQILASRHQVYESFQVVLVCLGLLVTYADVDHLNTNVVVDTIIPAGGATSTQLEGEFFPDQEKTLVNATLVGVIEQRLKLKDSWLMQMFVPDYLKCVIPTRCLQLMDPARIAPEVEVQLRVGIERLINSLTQDEHSERATFLIRSITGGVEDENFMHLLAFYGQEEDFELIAWMAMFNFYLNNFRVWCEKTTNYYYNLVEVTAPNLTYIRGGYQHYRRWMLAAGFAEGDLSLESGLATASRNAFIASEQGIRSSFMKSPKTAAIAFSFVLSLISYALNASQVDSYKTSLLVLYMFNFFIVHVNSTKQLLEYCKVRKTLNPGYKVGIGALGYYVLLNLVGIASVLMSFFGLFKDSLFGKPSVALVSGAPLLMSLGLTLFQLRTEHKQINIERLAFDPHSPTFRFSANGGPVGGNGSGCCPNPAQVGFDNA